MNSAVISALIQRGADCTRCIDEFLICYRNDDRIAGCCFFTRFVLECVCIRSFFFGKRKHLSDAAEFFNGIKL